MLLNKNIFFESQQSAMRKSVQLIFKSIELEHPTVNPVTVTVGHCFSLCPRYHPKCFGGFSRHNKANTFVCNFIIIIQHKMCCDYSK